MAQVAVDRDGAETIFEWAPYRCDDRWDCDFSKIELPIDSIEKLIGEKLTWEDEAVELFQGVMNTKMLFWIAMVLFWISAYLFGYNIAELSCK